MKAWIRPIGDNLCFLPHTWPEKIGAIYHLDNPLSDLPAEERRSRRQLVINPLVEDFFVWMKKIKEGNILSPGSETMEGINYYLNHEEQ